MVEVSQKKTKKKKNKINQYDIVRVSLERPLTKLGSE